MEGILCCARSTWAVGDVLPVDWRCSLAATGLWFGLGLEDASRSPASLLHAASIRGSALLSSSFQLSSGAGAEECSDRCGGS